MNATLLDAGTGCSIQGLVPTSVNVYGVDIHELGDRKKEVHRSADGKNVLHLRGNGEGLYCERLSTLV